MVWTGVFPLAWRERVGGDHRDGWEARLMASEYWLDRDCSVLCEYCAEESKDHWIKGFRPVSGPYPTGTEALCCDECGEEIPASEEAE